MIEENLLQEKLMKYHELYSIGLKKQANSSMKEAMLWFDALEDNKKIDLVNLLCKDFCDDKLNFMFLLKRGNGEMPFELKNRVERHLKIECQTQKMPQMRWYYELFCRTQYCEYAYEMLYKAYRSALCDPKTVNLYFIKQLDILDWGAHHFPEGCIITKEAYQETVKICYEVINNHDVRDVLIDDFNYYKNLYKSFWEYIQNKDEVDFYKLCENNKIKFSSVKTYYYNLK